MKKLFYILLAVMSFVSINAFAQEVRGVETRIVIYEGPTYDKSSGYNTWAAYEFTNLNSIPVCVDATLHNNMAGVRSKKSFVLQPGESYLWKHEQEDCRVEPHINITRFYGNFKTYGR